MPIITLNHYNLRASRQLLGALRTFYCDVVGLTEGARPPFRFFGYWLYAGENPILHLSEAGAEEGRTAGAVNTFDHVAFTCRGRVETEAHLTRHGVAYRRTEVPLTRQVQLVFKDPAGNGVELNFADPADLLT
ncbi:MAG: VOC family protein [Usitatibacteraceae bacterium]